jgi:intraflagellar transport protein 80
MSAKLFYRAIKMNIKLYKWDRALEIAVNNKTHVDTVIAYRQRFLEQYGKEETNERFKQYSRDIEVNWETVKTKINADKKREQDANQ